MLDGVNIVLSGAGDTRFRLLVTLPGAWLIMVAGAWSAALVYLVLLASLFTWRFWSGRWKHKTLA